MVKRVTYTNGETPRICIIGAGFSGLGAAIQLKRQLGLDSFTIFDNNHEVGGTWLVNTYPGCACDIPSHLYSFSFEPNAGWSNNYASQPEIWRYLRGLAHKYGLYERTKLKTQVLSVCWEEELNKWRVRVRDLETEDEEEYLFDIVINGPGGLRVPNLPPEFRGFKGPTMHSAEWDNSIEIDNKTVAVVGSGASAIQIIPAIAKRVKDLHVYQRRAAYVVPRAQFPFPSAVQWIFRSLPLVMRLYRTFIFLLNELRFNAFKVKTSLSSAATQLSIDHLRKQIPDNEKLRLKLTPNYPFGCKRVVTSGDYYPALALANVHVHVGAIKAVDENHIVSEDGKREHIDVLILATGFRIQDYFKPMKVVGTNSEDIVVSWIKDHPQCYYGITAVNVPNHFMLLGPNTGLGHNSVIFLIECQVNMIVSLIGEMMRRGAHRLTVKQEAQNRCQERIFSRMKETVWGNSECGSWYANARGQITTLWPESCVSYWRQTRTVNYSDFTFE